MRVGMMAAVGMLAAMAGMAHGEREDRGPSQNIPSDQGTWSWRLKPSGPGILDRELTYVELRQLLSDAQIEIERKIDGDGTPYVSLESNAHYLVVRLHGEELFRSDCRCYLSQGAVLGRGGTREQEEKFKLENVPIAPITNNPRYKTESGVGVGNTVAELLKAERIQGNTGKLIANVNGWDLAPTRGLPKKGDSFPYFGPEGYRPIEYVCFYGGEEDRTKARPALLFFIKPPRGKFLAAKYRHRDSIDTSTEIDTRAEIVAIQTNAACFPDWNQR